MEHAIFLKRLELIDSAGLDATQKFTLRIFLTIIDAQEQFEREHNRRMTYEDALDYFKPIPNPTTYGTEADKSKQRS